MSAKRNLLLGMLALQNNFITRTQLLAAFNVWVEDKIQPLGGLLLEQKALTAPQHALLEALTGEHLRQHDGDADKSLAAFSSAGSARRHLAKIADPDVRASLLSLAKPRDESWHQDPAKTRGESSNAAGPDGDADPFATVSAPPADSARRFVFLRPHASGGLGTVSVALDLELHRQVALKQIKEQHAKNTDARARFLLEAEITGGLEHPGIVPVYSLGSYADGRPYYAMRFIKGDSLKEAIDRFHHKDEGRRTNAEGGSDSSFCLHPSAFSSLEFRKLLGRFVDVCNAIAYAHSRGVLHRDLKPGNIMLGQYGETLVVDWGLAKAVGSQGEAEAFGIGANEATLRPTSGNGSCDTLPGSALGTPAYMSPEQAAGKLDHLGPASDVYSLGATLYHLVAGKPPFDGRDSTEILRRVQAGDFPAPRQLQPAVSPALEAVCLKAMALLPANRYSSPRELSDDLEHWLADEPIHLAVQADLDEVARLQGAAQWADARAALGRAEGRLGMGGPSDLRSRVEQSRRDLNVLLQLDAIRMEQLTYADENRTLADADRAYAAAFAEAGLGTIGDDPQAVADRVKALIGCGLVVGALDDWAACTSDCNRLRWVLEVARRADPDPWRDRMRDLSTFTHRAALERLAAEEAATVQSPLSIDPLGYRLVKAGGDAADLLQRVQARHPGDVWLNLHLGDALINRDPKEAVGYYRAALAVRPDTPIILYALGNALKAQARLEEAKTEFRKAIALNPRFALPHTVLGTILRTQGRLEEAKAEYEKSIALDPKHGYPHLGLSIVLHDLGQLARASAEWEAAIALDPRLAEARGNLDLALQADSRLDVAVENRNALEPSREPASP